MKSILTFLLLLATASVSLAQNRIASLWQSEATPTELVGTRMILPSVYQSFNVSLADLRAQLVGLPLEADLMQQPFDATALPIFSLPMADGSIEEFAIFESPCMEAGLAAKYPSIKTYKGKGVQHPEAMVRFDVTPLGFHATVWYADHTIYIDPITSRDTDHYIVYDTKNYRSQSAPMVCEMTDGLGLTKATNAPVNTSASAVLASAKLLPPPTTGPTLRTYRLALACTGEYSAFHNTAAGTTNNTATVLAAMTTSINRVNGVYERELAIHFNLVANNNLLVFHDANTDGYTNTSGSTMLNENQTKVDAIIQPANYDMGHVYSTGGGGVAQLGCICGTSKARGVTGRDSPVGDPFDIDYVVHEMGHQFGGNHTFNGDQGSCSGNRVSAHAFEPGSGVTIMAYAGICGIDDIAPNSIDIMHTGSFDEMVAFSQTAGGNTCPVKTQSGNRTPVAITDATVYTIPLNTPFELIGSGTDADNDALTYCWEEVDLGPACRVDQPVLTAPLFRSFNPSTSPIRTFPKSATLVAGGLSNFGETLPTYARDMNFRMTVRDNHALCGGATYSGAKVVASAVATNFKVTSQSTTGLVYPATSIRPITWDVANTTASPISATAVDIFLSLDGGLTYPTTIATNVPNNGVYNWTVNSTASTTCRVKVKAKNNVFFDINDVNFEIRVYTTPDFALTSLDTAKSVCVTAGTVSFIVSSEAYAGLTTPIVYSVTGIPMGSTPSWLPSNTVAVGTNVTFTLTLGAGVATGVYNLNIRGVSSGKVHNVNCKLRAYNGIPVTPNLTTPANAATLVNPSTPFVWTAAAGTTSYTLEVANNAAFNTPIITKVLGTGVTSYTPTTALPEGQQLYWRVRTVNPCGNGVANTAAFATAYARCLLYNPIGLSIDILSGMRDTVRSEIYVSDVYTIQKTRVLNVQGTHSYISDLKMNLTAPSGTVVDLLPRSCSNEDDFELSFDDKGQTYIPCPIAGNVAVKPVTPLSAVNGQSFFGTWKLTIADVILTDGGSLDNWQLELCTLSATAYVGTDAQLLAANKVLVFPNPAHHEVNIALQDIQGAANITIFNMAGQVITKTTATGLARINTSEYAAGIYIINVQTNEGVYNEKVVISN